MTDYNKRLDELIRRSIKLLSYAENEFNLLKQSNIQPSVNKINHKIDEITSIDADIKTDDFCTYEPDMQTTSPEYYFKYKKRAVRILSTNGKMRDERFCDSNKKSQCNYLVQIVGESTRFWTRKECLKK